MCLAGLNFWLLRWWGCVFWSRETPHLFLQLESVYWSSKAAYWVGQDSQKNCGDQSKTASSKTLNCIVWQLCNFQLLFTTKQFQCSIPFTVLDPTLSLLFEAFSFKRYTFTFSKLVSRSVTLILFGNCWKLIFYSSKKHVIDGEEIKRQGFLFYKSHHKCYGNMTADRHYRQSRK